MTTILSIKGQPVFTAEFDDVPSRNQTNSWRRNIEVKAQWRFEGKEKALNFRGYEFDQEFFAKLAGPIIKECALVVATVYLSNMGVADIHNPDIKPILDGFSDAQIYMDDEWAFVPLVLFAWGGITPGKKSLRIDVYELDSYIINGTMQALPAGRSENNERDVGIRKAGKHTKVGSVVGPRNTRKNTRSLRDKPQSRTK